MAKWGEGDPRWIVEERPDATNVNNWHWFVNSVFVCFVSKFVFLRTEKDASHWSRDRLKQLFLGLEIDDANLGKCSITEVSSIEGEALANNRKGKLIFFYEWVIKCNWNGNVNGEAEETTGTLEIPNLSEENTADEINVDVSLTKSGPKADLLKDLVRTKGLTLIRDKVKLYITALRDEFAKDMIKPTKFSNDGTINSFQTAAQTEKKEPTLQALPTTKKLANTNNNNGLKIETCQLQLSDTFKCTADELYRVLTDPGLLQAFTQTTAVSEPVVGGKICLLGGNITGKYLQLQQPTCIKQNWRIKSWPAEHYSEVTITIKQESDTTSLSLTQVGVPRADFDRTEDGWRRHYFESIKRIFGFGSAIF